MAGHWNGGREGWAGGEGKAYVSACRYLALKMNANFVMQLFEFGIENVILPAL